MSLPPSALYKSPQTGVLYNQLDTCLYSNADNAPGAASTAPAAAGDILKFDADPAGAVGVFQQFGNSCGLTINRVVPAADTNTRAGALLNSGTLPVSVSGVVAVDAFTADTIVGYIAVKRQDIGQDFNDAVFVGGAAVPAGVPVAPVAGTITVPFATILKPGQSLFCQNIIVQTAGATFRASLQAVRAQVVYGTMNSQSIPVVGP